MSEKIRSALFFVLRSVILNVPMTDEEKAAVQEESLNALMNLSVQHDVGHLVAYGLQHNQLVDENSNIRQQIFLAVYRYEKLNYDLNRTCEVLEQAKLPFIPLKGSVLRKLYPEPWMRTSCDIDLLVHESDLDAAVACLTKELGYTETGKGSHDVSLSTPAGMHIELHYSLIESNWMEKAELPLRTVWEDAKPVEGTSFHYALSDEMFYYYHIAHMAKHFLYGGCGIRPLLDLYLLKRDLSMDAERRDALLSLGGLLEFARQAEQLAMIWLDGAVHTDLTMQMEDYIFSGGVYGTLENRVMTHQIRKGGKLKYALSRIWISSEQLKYVYPVLNRKKWMLPICQVRRWFRLVFGGKLKSSMHELRYNASVSDDEQREIGSLLSQLGL